MNKLGNDSLDCINNIQYFIGINLIKTRKRPNIKMKIEINKELMDFLSLKYHLNGRFKNCPNFLKDFKLVCTNFHDESNFHQINLETFQLKLTKEKNVILKTKIKNKIKTKTIHSKPSLTIKFNRENIISLNESELNSLNEYRNNYKNSKN